VFLDGGESAQRWRHVLDRALTVLPLTFFLFFLHSSLTLTLPLMIINVNPLLYLLYLLVDFFLTDITALRQSEGSFSMLAKLSLRVVIGRVEVYESVEVLDLSEKAFVLFTGCRLEYVMEMKKLSSCCCGSSLPLLTSS
jgi:hypothetical protein